MTVFATMFANFRPYSFHFSSSLEYLPFYVSNPSITPPHTKSPRRSRCFHLHTVNAPSLPELLSFIFYLLSLSLKFPHPIHLNISSPHAIPMYRERFRRRFQKYIKTSLQHVVQAGFITRAEDQVNVHRDGVGTASMFKSLVHRDGVGTV